MKNSKNILITGGTGLIGTAVRTLFESKGYQTAILSRTRNNPHIKSFFWDPQNGEMDPDAIEFADLVIHLAGDNIGSGRWTPQKKRDIIDSRVFSGSLLCKGIAKATQKPICVISASAIGYYGSQTTDRIFTESDLPGNDFLAEVVKKWEESLIPLEELGVGLNRIRIGVVVSEKGGALGKMETPLKWGLGAALGSGNQWMPWISLEDLAGIFLFLVENNISGEVFNAVSPQHVNNRTFMATLAKQLDKPYFLPNVPDFALRLALGEMATIVLDGSRVSSEKIRQKGFKFKHETLEQALESIYSYKKN